MPREDISKDLVPVDPLSHHHQPDVELTLTNGNTSPASSPGNVRCRPPHHAEEFDLGRTELLALPTGVLEAQTPVPRQWPSIPLRDEEADVRGLHGSGASQIRAQRLEKLLSCAATAVFRADDNVNQFAEALPACFRPFLPKLIEHIANQSPTARCSCRILLGALEDADIPGSFVGKHLTQHLLEIHAPKRIPSVAHGASAEDLPRSKLNRLVCPLGATASMRTEALLFSLPS
mmetsp:Transcript_6378/g.15691  ORF Transcript_6378/g.15691 Transcript_6378/m.15691 type:complete len:233 (-) Transcript_6378:33-731(-)